MSIIFTCNAYIVSIVKFTDIKTMLNLLKCNKQLEMFFKSSSSLVVIKTYINNCFRFEIDSKIMEEGNNGFNLPHANKFAFDVSIMRNIHNHLQNTLIFVF